MTHSYFRYIFLRFVLLKIQKHEFLHKSLASLHTVCIRKAFASENCLRQEVFLTQLSGSHVNKRHSCNITTFAPVVSYFAKYKKLNSCYNRLDEEAIFENFQAEYQKAESHKAESQKAEWDKMHLL